jgi:hypothetical protein
MIDAAGFFANTAASMTTKTRSRIIMLFILAFPFTVLFGFLISQVVGPLPPVQPLPNPNGYDDLVKAGKMVVINATVNTTFYGDMGEAQLQEVVLTNADALALARAGLSNECRVPVQYSQTYMSNHLDDLASLKHMAQAFCAESKLTEMENRPNDAAKSYLDTVHLGNEAMRGGVLIDALVGIAIENLGTSHLTNLVDKLDANSCRETATVLETVDSQRPTWNEIMQQENIWRKAFERLQKIPASKMPMIERMAEKTDQACELKFNTLEQKTRRAMIDLAARAYELDKGKSPASLADLVPDYLKAVPQDPLTGTNMVYSPR